MPTQETGVATSDIASDTVDFPLPTLKAFAWRVVSLHVLTYFALGIAAFLILDYRQAFQNTELRYLMRPTTSPWVAAGPAFQLVRGLLFAAILYPFASHFIRRSNGALLLWTLFLGLAILGTAGPSPGSFEGILYTKLPIKLHLFGLPEVVLQTLLFSIGLVSWCRKPARWKNIASGIGVALVLLMSAAGVLAALKLG
ncbi:MAG TPA: hypothetical protein VE398_19180 [Acidobacteriota bacterium]|nr:hypothetical protein [Acidobacteriota bacterium]